MNADEVAKIMKARQIHDQAEIETAISKVALAAFYEDMGEDAFMSLNCDGLIAFSRRNNISRLEINIAWHALQRRDLLARDRAYWEEHDICARARVTE